MNKFELLVYNVVKRNIFLKRLVRDIYQRIFVLVTFSWARRTQSQYNIEREEYCFFGYYDKSPWSYDDKYLLAQHFTQPLRMPLKNDTVEIRCYQGKDYKVLGKTCAWNWQQGAMLQWVGNTHTVLFNDYDGKQHVARIVDLQGRETQRLPLPAAALSPDGRRIVSYSFERLQRCASGYAYINGGDPYGDDPAPDGDGLYAMDIQDRRGILLLSLSEVATHQPDSSMAGAYHYINHAAFSPSGTKVVFFHRWKKPNREWTRMFTYNLTNQRLHLFSAAGMVSHFTWRDDNHVLAWARLPDRKNDAYVLFTDGSQQKTVIGEEVFTSDGHPSFSPDGRYILTDTYPDRARISRLILYDTKTGKREDIAKVYSPFRYTNDLRCDLHPRWDRTGRKVSFDAVFTGVRSLCMITLPQQLS